jgi:hypothetical protein
LQGVGVVGAEGPFSVGEGALEQGDGLVGPARGLASEGEVAPGLQGGRVIGAEDLLHVGEGALVQRDGLVDRERRQQLKWLLGGSAVTGVCLTVTFIASGSGTSGVLGIVGVIVIGGLLALPLSIGVAILKYRLFDIDRVISRTLSYAIVTSLLIGVYAGVVLLATRVVSITTPVAVAASTLAAADLFNPVRRRVQRLVDRRFNRARYDADRMVAAFAARLQDAVDLNSVRDDLATVVDQALEPAHVSVWISQQRWAFCRFRCSRRTTVRREALAPQAQALA